MSDEALIEILNHIEGSMEKLVEALTNERANLHPRRSHRHREARSLPDPGEAPGRGVSMKSTKPEVKALKISEVATRLSCDPQTVHKMIDRGRIVAVDLHKGMKDANGLPYTRMFRIPETEIERILEGK